MRLTVMKTPDLCSGDACIQEHRIPVWGLVRLRQLGATTPKLLEAYPSLTPADLEAAWKYYEANKSEINQAIQENEEGEEGFVE